MCMNQRGLPAVPTAQAACSPGNLSLLPWSGCCWLCAEANLQPALKTPQGHTLHIGSCLGSPAPGASVTPEPPLQHGL